MLVRSGLRANKHHWCPVSGMPSRLIALDRAESVTRQLSIPQTGVFS